MRGLLIGGTQVQNPKTKEAAFSLDLLDLDAAEPASTVRRVRLDFLAHGFTTDPRAPHVAALFEKRGPGGAVVDLAAAKVLARVEPTPGCAFYGHGQHSVDGAVVFAIETTLATGAGVLTVRDADTFALLDEFPTYGDKPHDCALVDGGKTLVVTNGGMPLGAAAARAPCVTFVDVASRKLLDKVVFSDPKINAGHIALAAAEAGADFAVSSAPRDGLPEKESVGGLTLRVARRKAQRMKKPERVTSRMLGESLSVCIHAPTRVAAVTNPYGDLLTFWSLDEQRLVKAIDLEFPRGVALTLDGDAFVVTYGKTATLKLIATSTLEPVAGDAAPDFGHARFSGSHVYVRDPHRRR